MQNPFRDIVKADDLDPDLAARLFVPKVSPIWKEVPSPRNHIIVGPRGAGKTIALRQLDSRTHTEPKGYIGIYVQISRISALYKNPFEHLRERSSATTTVMFQQVFSDHLWLSIVRSICEYLKNFSINELDNLADIKRLFGIDMASIDSLDNYCAERHRRIEEALISWSRDEHLSWQPVAHVPEALQRCVDHLRTKLPRLATTSPCLYLLLDESSPIPRECQLVLNELLHRGRNYCVKLAIRPFEWDTLRTNRDRTIEVDTDLIVSNIRYSNELEDQYITNMETLVERVLKTQLPAHVLPFNSAHKLDISSIFPAHSDSQYSGFHSICAASSGNPQNLLQICSCIFQATESVQDIDDQSMPSFPPSIQDQAIRAWSRDHEDYNPYANSRSFCRSLLRSIRTNQSSQKSIGFSYSHSPEADLFTHDYLPQDIGELVKSAFSGGFLRRTSADPTSLFEVPSEFHLSRGLLPREDLPVDLPIHPTTPIDQEFIRNNTRDHIRATKPVAVAEDKRIKAFLSTSFSRLMQQQRADIKRYLQMVAIDCVDVEDRLHEQFLFTSIQRQITAADFVILDATILRPYTMFEIGICAGLPSRPKNVICVFNSEVADDPIDKLPSFMQKLPIICFSYADEQLQKAAAEIAERARVLIPARSEFSYIGRSNTPLRPKQRRDRKTVYVSLPSNSIRGRALEAVRKELEQQGWNVIDEEQARIYLANELQTAITCAFTARVGVIDTSGKDGPDLLQCFKLGLFVGKQNWRVLQTERLGEQNERTFSSVPGIEYKCWADIDGFVRNVTAFVTNHRVKTGG